MSLSTLGTITDFVKNQYRVTSADTSLDTIITSFINKNLLRRQAMVGWKESMVSSSFTCTANQSTYATSTDFLRLVPNSVRYGITATSTGRMLPELTGEEYQYYRQTTSSADPFFVFITDASSGSAKVVKLIPQFTNGSSVVSYDYYAKPTALTASSDALRVISLGEVVAYDSLVDLAMYQDDDKRAAYFQGQAKESWRGAFQSIGPTGLT